MHLHIDELARQCASGLSRRAAFATMLRLLFGGLLAWIAAFRAAFGQSCYDACKIKCTRSNGRLDFTCFRACINSDPNNCGGCGIKCAAGASCVNGRCLGGEDRPTVQSLLTAEAALRAGAVDVAISPGGTIRYKKTVSNGVTVADQLVYGSFIDQAYTYTSTEVVGYQDADKDGFAERRKRKTLLPWGSVQVETFEFNPKTRLLSEHVTQLFSGASVHVTYRQQLSPGMMTVTRDYIAPAESDALSTVSGGLCSPADCDPAALKVRMLEAMTSASNDCGLKTLADEVYREFLSRPYELRCDTAGLLDDLPDSSLANTKFGDPVLIRVNRDTFCRGLQGDGKTPETDQQVAVRQKSLLFHEAMHAFTDYPRERDEDAKSENPHERDRTYACEATCFGFRLKVNGWDPSACACALCTGKKPCDAPCDSKHIPCKPGAKEPLPDFQNDENHCGGCNKPCAKHATCQNGTCVDVCPPGTIRCRVGPVGGLIHWVCTEPGSTCCFWDARPFPGSGPSKHYVCGPKVPSLEFRGLTGVCCNGGCCQEPFECKPNSDGIGVSCIGGRT